jgi:predicted O-linked N-acetylglucosamine transferase (SPINDLY family)
MPQNWMLIPASGADQDDEWVRLGVDAHVGNRLAEAQQKYQQALRLNPRNAIATQNLALVFAATPGLLNEARLTIERAEMMDGVHATIKMNRALVALESEDIDQALASARASVEQAPTDVPALMALATVLTTAGYAGEALPIYDRILTIDPRHPAAGPNSCFIQTLANCTPADLLRNRQRWYAANKWEGTPAKHANDRSTDRPIRVGYVGGDFKSHSAAFIFRHVLLHHTTAVEMYLYSTLPVDANADAATKKFMEAVQGYETILTTPVDDLPSRLSGPQISSPVARNRYDLWRDISAMNDEDAAALIRKDRIDILVDLAGHTNGGRLALFTRKPAPVQAAAWGFAHGTGLPEIDYFLADQIAVPPDERQHYAEKIIDLPCIVTMEPPTEYKLKAASMPPVRKNGFVTFGSYARYEKMSDECIRTFAEILRQVPDSRLEFKDNAYRRPYSIRRIYSLMLDIARDRLLFSIGTNHPDHMLAYQQADLCLDPWPHGGGVVALEQLYMSVPLVTLYGTQPSGRSAASVLTCMGRADWVAKTPEEYVKIAVAMAGDPKALAECRKTLRDELLRSPAVAGYVEKVEEAYKQMWKGWCER